MGTNCFCESSNSVLTLHSNTLYCTPPHCKGPNSLSGTSIGRGHKTRSCYGSRQTLTSSSFSVLCLMRTLHARFLSDTTDCPKATRKSIARECPIVDQSLHALHQSLSVAQSAWQWIRALMHFTKVCLSYRQNILQWIKALMHFIKVCRIDRAW